LTFAVALLAVACGAETAATPSPSPPASAQSTHSPSPAGQTFNINPEPGVKAAGTITVFAAANRTTIEVKVSGLQPNSSHISHIHLGSCSQRGPIQFALNQVIADGQGDADVRTTLNNVKFPPTAGTWYVVVHAGPDMQGSSSTYLLCGNLFFQA
jgi:Cu/Zn superoxide dismutase